MTELFNINTKETGLKMNYKPTKRSSQKVKDLSEIIDAVNRMYPSLEETGFPTLHHSEVVTDKPFDFFVINKKYRFMWSGYGLIINPKIVAFSDARQALESCAQFPFRGKKTIRRYNKITIEAITENPETGHLMPVVIDLVGGAAYLTQHNIDHAGGKHIFTNKK